MGVEAPVRIEGFTLDLILSTSKEAHLLTIHFNQFFP